MAGSGRSDRGDAAGGGHAGDAGGGRRVRVLGLGDAPEAAAVLATVFVDEPAKLALIPDADGRRRLTEAVALARVRALAPYAAAHAVEVDGAIAAVALWHPPNVRPGVGSVLPLLRAALAPGTRAATLAGRALRSLWRDRRAVRRLAAGRLEAARAARAGQSWYLALLGTDPRFRGHGLATQLLRHTLSRCDADGLPTWLETTTAENVAFYRRLGFMEVAAIPGGALIPDVWVLRRNPGGQGRAGIGA